MVKNNLVVKVTLVQLYSLFEKVSRFFLRLERILSLSILTSVLEIWLNTDLSISLMWLLLLLPTIEVLSSS